MYTVRNPLIWSLVIHLLVLAVALFVPLSNTMEILKPAMTVSLVQRPTPTPPRYPTSPSTTPKTVPPAQPSPKEPPKLAIKAAPPKPAVKAAPPKPVAKIEPPKPAVKAAPPKPVSKEAPPASTVAVEPPKPANVPPPPLKVANVRPKTKPKPVGKPNTTPKQKPRRVTKKPPEKTPTVEKSTAKPTPAPSKPVTTARDTAPLKVPVAPAAKQPAALDFSDAIAKLQASRPAPSPIQADTMEADRGAVARWQQHVHNKIYDNWNKPSGLLDEQRLAVTVSVTVTPSGVLAAPHILQGSGNGAFDTSVIRAIQKTARVEQAPQGCRECQDLEIGFRPE